MAWWRRRPADEAGSGEVTASPGPGAEADGRDRVMTTRHVVDRVGRVRYAVRDAVDAGQRGDNGWRVFSDVDTDEYIADPTHLVLVDVDDLCALEPALAPLWSLPVGSAVELVRRGAGVVLVDAGTGEPLVLPAAD